MFKLLELSLADTRRLYQYKQTSPLDLEFGLKGFDYGWLLANHAWTPTEKVLDVGGAYSQLPLYLQQHYGCETWVVDDFGLNVNDPFWTRNKSPQEYISQHPQVKFILERVGDPQHSSLQMGYFAVVYSISVLEHVPWNLTPAVWQHLGSLVKPGGELIHAIDIPFASNGGLSKMIKATLFDAFSPLVPAPYKLSHYMATPMNYSRLVFRSLGIPAQPGRGLSVWRMALDPEIMTEGFEYGYNRIQKDQMKDYHHMRTGSLLIRLRKELS
jgi:SAM-dependent methyltransferase